MSGHAEILLMAIAVGLYLYDSLLLLCFNEAVLFHQGRRWRVGFGSTRARMRERELYLPSPFAPQRPIFRMAWRCEAGSAAASATDWEALSRRFSALSPCLLGMALALFLLLPLGLFTRLGDAAILTAVALLYANILGALAWVWLKRDQFGVSLSRFAAIAFESIVCAPCALNLVRKLSLGVSPPEDLLAAARQLQGAEDWADTRAACISRIDEELEAEEEGSERLKALAELKLELNKVAAECPPAN